MATDWRSELTDLRNRLETTRQQHSDRDHYHHGVVFIAAEPSDEFMQLAPTMYACGLRVAEKHVVRSPSGGHYLHFIFDNSGHDAPDDVLHLFRRELARVQKLLKMLPKKLCPEISFPPMKNGAVENMLHWISLLHWLGRQRTGIFESHIEFLPSTNDYLNGMRHREWSECSTVADFDPISLMSLTLQKGENLNIWQERHVAAGKQLPEVISSSLSKPLLYASHNALNWLLDRSDGGEQHRNRREDARKKDILSQDGDELLTFLVHHHRCKPGSKCEQLCVPIPNQAVMAEMINRWTNTSKWNQSRVSRALGEVLSNVKSFDFVKTGHRYKRLCHEGIICRELLFVQAEQLAPRIRQELQVEDMDRFAADDDDACGR